MNQHGDYRYRIKSTGGSSERYGNCEVCNKSCSDVHLQTEEQFYSIPFNGSLETGWSHRNMIFGHEGCLMSKRHQ